MSLTAPILDSTTWSESISEARRGRTLYNPEWTDHCASDPTGTVLVGGIALSAFTVAYLAALRKVLGIRSLRRYGAIVTSPVGRWLPVDSLSEAGPADRVYEINRSTGVVRFGDGVNGERPPAGLTVCTHARHTARGVLAGVLGALAWAGIVDWLWIRRLDRDPD